MTEAEERQVTEIGVVDEHGNVKQVEVKELTIDKKFDSVLINFKSQSGEIKKYFLRRTKRDRLVLT